MDYQHSGSSPIEVVAVPLQEKDRIVALDILRGFAICGILIMNIQFFGRSFYSGDPRVFNELSQPANKLTWFLVDYVFEGSMRGLFSVLFGAGAVLFLSRLEQRMEGMKPAEIYVRRLIWLLVFGLINGYVFIWPGDILFHYAIVGLFLIPFRHAKPKLLIGLIVFFIAITCLKSVLKKQEFLDMRQQGISAQVLKDKNQKLSEEQEAALDKWNGYNEERKPVANRKKAEKEIREISSGSYAKIWKNWTRWTVKLETIKFHGGFFFDIIIFFLLGIFLYNSGILTGQKSMAFYAILMVVSYTIGLALGYLDYAYVRSSNFDTYTYILNYPLPFSLYQVHRVGTTLGHMSLILLVYKSGMFNWLLYPFRRMGQMAFSNYLLQSIICGAMFMGIGLGLFGKYQRYEMWYFWAGVCAFEMVLSIVWLQFFRFGPFEWLWRSLTYWKWLPLKRKHKFEPPGATD